MVSLNLSLHLLRPKCPSKYNMKCSLMFLVGNNNESAIQDNPIFHCQLFPEGPIWLDFAWNLSDGTWQSMHDSVLE